MFVSRVKRIGSRRIPQNEGADQAATGSPQYNNIEGQLWRTPELTAAEERGEQIFERNVDNFGNPIPEANRCSTCHMGPDGTDHKTSDVGTKRPTDRSALLKTPQLTNVALMAPYLHDGSAPSLEEIWTVFNPGDKHGRTNDLTKNQLNDLIDYLRTR